MNRRDIEMIAALAEGRLQDETDARALVASSPAHRAEYEAQKAAIGALASIGPARLTDSEAAALQRDVWSELRSGSTPEPVRSPWVARLSYAAAGLFVVIGLVAVLNQDQVAETFFEVGSALDGGDPAAPAVGEDAGPTATTDTGSTEAEAVPPADEELFLATATRLRSKDMSALQLEESQRSTANECLLANDLEDFEVRAEIGDETRYFVAAIPGEDPPVTLHFLDAETCELVYTHFEQP